MARRPYSTDCRFFKDSGTIVRVRWYPVTLPVKCLPFPSKINSLDWSSHPWLAEGVGEVYGGDRPYNAAEAIPYARGLTPCQTAEVFAEGETFDPSAPAQEYDDKGLALCCVNHFTGSGGVLWDGSAVVNVVTPSGPALVCSGSERLVPGAWVTYTMQNPGAFQDNFWIVDLPAGSAYRFQLQLLNIGAGFGAGGGNLYFTNPTNPCFATGPGWGTLFPGNNDHSGVTPPGTYGLRVQVRYHPDDLTTTYKVRVD